MKSINNKRAKFLFNLFNETSYEIDVCAMIPKLFSSEPSYTEQLTCNSCTYSDSKTFAMVSMNYQIFANNFANLEQAILKSVGKHSACNGCKSKIECNCEFGQHVFIKVINISFYCIWIITFLHLYFLIHRFH